MKLKVRKPKPFDVVTGLIFWAVVITVVSKCVGAM